MYRGTPSPIFDVPEFPTLRRIKPLPKRRRTTGPTQENTPPVSQLSVTLNPQNTLPFLPTPSQPELHRPSLPIDSLIPNPMPDELFSHADSLSTRIAMQNYYLPILGNVQNFLAGHGANADGNIANSATAAAAAAALAAVTSAGRNGPLPMPHLSDLDSIEFGVHFAAAAAAAAAAGIHMGGLGGFGSAGSNMNSLTGMVTSYANETSPLLSNCPMRDTPEELIREGGDGVEEDYCDRVRRPGNTKKRKVPANLSGSPRSANAGESTRRGSQSDDEDTTDSYPVAVGGFSAPDAATLRDNHGDRDRNRDYDSMSPSPVYPPPSFPGQMSMLTQKKGKLTAATLAGLQHKEMLKARKRQLGSVMGALSYGDTFIIDHALSIHFPFSNGLGGGSGESLKVRKSKRRSVRLARAMTIMMETPDRKNRHPDAVPFRESDFEFKCPSATSSRLASTKEEVAALRRRFEAELKRQADKAAKAAISESGKAPAKNSRAKRERQEKERERTARAERQKKIKANAPSDHLELTGSRTTSSSAGLAASSVASDGVDGKVTKAKNGKKKRSALANASNPHHLKNYVPSRLPHSGPLDAHGQGPTNNIWPLPVRFLAAEIPPRIPKGGQKVPLANTPLVQVTQPGEEWICAFCEYDLFYSDELAYQRAVRNRKRILRRRKRAAERAAAAASGSTGNSMLKAPPPSAEQEYDDGHGRAAGTVGVAENGSAPPQRSAQLKGGPDKEPTAYG